MEEKKSSGPTTEEKLRKITVGELKPHNAPIKLVEYDPVWPMNFNSEARRIRRILGERAIQVEHIGSTAVPGLTAKPIIDILLVVKDSRDEASYVPDLEGAGYRLTIREPDWYEHRLFKGPDVNINLHVFTIDSPEIDRVLTLRDWLRNNPEDRMLYAETKRTLASQNWKYVQNYADAKSQVIEAIIAKARGQTRK